MKNNDDEKRFEALERIYAVFEKTVEEFNPVCKPKCALCCTCNVTLTSLETRYMIRMLAPGQKKMVSERLAAYFPEKRYAPQITINRYALLCMENKTTEDEENDPSWGRCAFLKDEICMVYQARPFGCRVMISQHNCEEKGYAQLPSFAQTLQTVFMQAVEHLDPEGVTGNLSEMLARQLLERNEGAVFAENQKVPFFMVPPEHRIRVKDILSTLSNLIQK